VRKTAAIGLALVFVVAGCALRSGGGDASQDPAAPADLAGSWLLRDSSGRTGPIAIVDGHDITLKIDGGQVSGRAACNLYGGTVSQTGDAIAITALSMTEMACADDTAMQSEADYMTALAAVSRWARDGDGLVLSGDGVRLTFKLVPPVPDAEIIGTRWVLETLVRADTASSVQGAPVLAFGADGSLTGSTGCREVTGTYRVAGDVFTSELAPPAGECSAALELQDRQIRQVLRRFTAAVEGRSLTLIGGDGQQLVFSAAPAPG
jgi:heat shock protein HslJ